MAECTPHPDFSLAHPQLGASIRASVLGLVISSNSGFYKVS